MANQVQGTVYQIDTTRQVEPIVMAFSTQNIIVREASFVSIPEIQSCIIYYQSPGNSPTEYFVSESYVSLVGSSNAGEVALIQATIASSGQSFGFPSQNISILGVNGGIEGANACIQYRGIPYYVTETSAELIAQSEPAYKVYTALLTQSGGSSVVGIYDGGDYPIVIGATYTIIDNGGSGWDFTNIGAPNNDIGTSFVATGTTPNSWGIDGLMEQNLGAPVVTVLENTIGNIWFTYSDIGQYLINFSETFLGEKTYAQGSSYTEDGTGFRVTTIITPGLTFFNLLITTTYPMSEAWSDGILNNTPIEIRVYN